MSDRSVVHSTFAIDRSYPHSPERVFSALSDPDRKRRWFMASDEKEGVEFEMDFRVGGAERSRSLMSAATPFPGAVLENHTIYLDIVPMRRIVFSYTMSMNGRRFSASLATIEVVPEGEGTRLSFTDQGAYFEGSDGPQMRQGGWRHLLGRLSDALVA